MMMESQGYFIVVILVLFFLSLTTFLQYHWSFVSCIDLLKHGHCSHLKLLRKLDSMPRVAYQGVSPKSLMPNTEMRSATGRSFRTVIYEKYRLDVISHMGKVDSPRRVNIPDWGLV